MGLTDTEIDEIDKEDDEFFNQLNDWLAKLSESSISTISRTLSGYRYAIKSAFLLEADKILAGVDPNDEGREDIIKNGMEPIIFHRPPTIVKAYSYYAQREYNIYLRFGYMLLQFNDNSKVQPKVKRVNGVDYVVSDSQEGDSLIKYFEDCKTANNKQFNSVTGSDFLEVAGRDYSEHKANFLNKFNLIEDTGYDLPIEHLYYSYYIAWDPKDLFKNPDPIKIGSDFLWQILTKKIDCMFNKKNYDYSERTEEYQKGINEVFTGNSYTFPELLNSATKDGLIKKIWLLFCFCRSKEFRQKPGYGIKTYEPFSIDGSVNSVNGKFSFLDIIEADNRLEPEHQIFIVERDDEGIFLFFEVAFKGKDYDNYRHQLFKYLNENSYQFHKDLFEYVYNYPDEIEFRKLYDNFSNVGLDKTKFNEVMRKLLDAVLTEYLISCNRKGLYKIYSEHFSSAGDYGKDFFEYVNSVINSSFSRTPNPNNVPPFIDEVVLRKEIDNIVDKSIDLSHKIRSAYPDTSINIENYENICLKYIKSVITTSLSLAMNYTHTESASYLDMLERNINTRSKGLAAPNNFVPFIDKVELCEKINKISDESFYMWHKIYLDYHNKIKIYYNRMITYNKGFLEFIEKKINESFDDFENKMMHLAKVTVDAGFYSDLRNHYHDMLVKNRKAGSKKPPIPDKVPPFIDEVELREKIDKIADESFGKLRKEFLMSFPYRKDKWVRSLYEDYCKKNISLLHDSDMEKIFYRKIKDISYSIVNFYNNNQEVMK
jgi:hypothetical protein